jgi:ABC-2 type transport system permease protein
MTISTDAPWSSPTPEPAAGPRRARVPRAERGGAARIVDRGYRAYTGPRLGARGAMRSLIVQTIQRALGIHRPVWAKIWPIAVIAMAYIPAIVFIGITVITKNLPGGTLRYQALIPSYGQYYGYVTAAIMIFVAFVAPEVLCTDRKNRMLGLYLSSPLTRTTYLVSKAVAVIIVLSVVTLGPALLMIIAFALNGNGPDGIVAFLEVVGRGIVAGLAVATLQTMLSLAISSTTTRKWAATAATIVILLGTGVISDLLITEGNASRNYFFVNLLLMPYELVLRIYGDPVHTPRYARTLETPALVAAYLGWTFLFGAFVWWRYQRIEVTR